MSPDDIEQAARQRINAVNDTLWSSAEILNYLYFAMVEFSLEVRCTESTHSLVSVSGTSEYTKPAAVMELQRVTYDGVKLKEIDLRTYDTLIGGNGTASSGTPRYYWLFEDVINLYPIPDTSALTIKLWTYDEPAVPTSSSTLLIPSSYHWALVEGTLYHMTTKEVGDPRAVLFEGKWERAKRICIAQNRRKRRSDEFARVKREEDMVSSDIGVY